jgi:pimeloyl-ACP methyl ester carboxylesterase
MIARSTLLPCQSSRRALLLQSTVIGALAAFVPLTMAVPADNAIRPYRVHVPEAALRDLRRRLAQTRWPDRETVDDRSQGVQLAKLQALVRYWGSDYDWRKAEAKLNAHPQFVTDIDGLDIHFLHVRSRHPNALPMVMTHGWPGSVLELLEVIAPLTDPTAHGGSAGDAFHLVLPSIPGYGFSGKPAVSGWNPDRIGRAWDVLMKRLGYHGYVSQGGDWGAIITDANRIERATTVPPEVARALTSGAPAPAGLDAEERMVFDEIRDFQKNGFGYAAIMGTRPQTIGYALADSPVAMAAWFYDKFADWVFTRGEPERTLTRDQMLDDITMYWLTNTGTSGARIYWENMSSSEPTAVSVPAAVTIFPGEVYRPPRSWAQRAYRNLIYYNRVEKGGHFAAWEEPQLFSAEIRAAFRSLR